MKTEGLQGSYDSIAQGAAALGCTKGELRKWKKLGAAGFRGSRFYPAEFLAWLKKHEEAAKAKLPDATNGVLNESPIDKEAWEVRRIRLQCEDLEVNIAAKRDRLLDAKMVATSWIFHTRRASILLDRMVPTLAPRLAGRSAREIEELMREAVEKAKAELRARPYGSSPASCQACGEKVELFLEPAATAVAPVVVAKGKEKKGKKK